MRQRQTWFVTGSSRGLGRAWVEAALRRGDSVAATARDVDALADLTSTYADAVLPLRVDVTDDAEVRDGVAAALAHFGGLDVVVNNAGSGHDGVVEDVTDDDARHQLDVNLLGALRVTRAVLPHLRERGRGLVVQMSTQGAHFGHAGLGLYHASKWALEGLTESLRAELAGTGVHATMIEPGAALTEWFPRMSRSPENPAYADALATRFGDFDPADMPTADAIVAAAMHAVDAEEPPARLLVTDQAYDNVVAIHRRRLEEFAAWEPVSRSARVSS